MTDESCPERMRLVESLAKAMNKKKRAESKPSSSSPEKVAAENELGQAVEAVRTKSADDLCGSKSRDKAGKDAA